MRGGTVNTKRVTSYKFLMLLLYKLKLLTWKEFKGHCNHASHINPLVKSNKLFIDPFKNEVQP